MYFAVNRLIALSLHQQKEQAPHPNSKMVNLMHQLSSRRRISISSSSSSERSTFSVRSTTEKSYHYLHQLMFDGNWSDATNFINANGKFARKKRVAPQFLNTLCNSDLLPIHFACSRSDVTYEFLEALLFAYPSSITKRESGCLRNCLHIAVKSRVPDEIISYLIRRYPEGVKMQDAMGRIPLHYALSNMRSAELIEELIAACPETLWAQDKLGWSPLHVAVGTLTPAEVIEHILSISAETITLTTQSGRTPMMIAMNSDISRSDKVIDMIAKTEEEFGKIPAIANYRMAVKERKSIFNAMSEACYV